MYIFVDFQQKYLKMGVSKSSMPFLEETYLKPRGIGRVGQQVLIDALEKVLEAKESQSYLEDPSGGLTHEEKEILEAGGLRFTRASGRDLVAETAVAYAELISTSLTATRVAEQVDLTPTRIRQLIKDRSIYSFELNGKRLVPEFQIHGNSFVPNITQVNQSLREGLHPVGVDMWFREDNPELFVDEATGECRSPLNWLIEGRDVSRVSFLARSI